MDEITLTGETTVSEIKDGKVTTYTITPEQFGLKRCEIAKLQGGDGAVNAQITRDILSGKEQGPKREIVLLNAGAALYIGKKADSIADGIALAAKTIDSGAAVRTLRQWYRQQTHKGLPDTENKKEAFHGIKHGMPLFFVLFHKILKKT